MISSTVQRLVRISVAAMSSKTSPALSAQPSSPACEPPTTTPPDVTTCSSPPPTEASEPEEKQTDERDGQLKRPLEGECDTEEPKKLKTNEEAFWRKKKMAMLLVYSGKGYLGMQRNVGFKTIEGELLEAMVRANIISADHAEMPNLRINFQRAARTDKGVSAAGQVISLKINNPEPVSRVNAELPGQIKVLAVKKATKGFCSKNNCNARTYIYMIPTFAFTPFDQTANEEFRITDEIIEKINKTLGFYKGTHNFHNFTSGKKPEEASARRYIIEFSIGQPFLRDGLEFAVITVKGQSFMLHQIRKMIGLTIAVVRGLAGMEVITQAWGPTKCDVPKAPGLGLILDKVHYDFYNKRFGSDGIHEAIDWESYQEEIEKFKEEHIYPTIINTEKEEKSMLQWMGTLHYHHFGIRPNIDQHPKAVTPIGQAAFNAQSLLISKLEEKRKEQLTSGTISQIATITPSCRPTVLELHHSTVPATGVNIALTPVDTTTEVTTPSPTVAAKTEVSDAAQTENVSSASTEIQTPEDHSSKETSDAPS